MRVFCTFQVDLLTLELYYELWSKLVLMVLGELEDSLLGLDCLNTEERWSLQQLILQGVCRRLVGHT